MRARQAFDEARRRLEAAGVEDAAFDAAALVETQAGEGWRWQDPALDEAEVMQQLDSLGVHIGAPIRSIDARSIRWKIL